jgi:hypothetical protein
MNDHLARALLVLAGLLLAAFWLAGASLAISLSLMGTLMANDAAAAPAEAQTRMVLLVLGGQLLAGAAGIPLGWAVFWRAKRKLLLRLFGALLVVGLMMIIAGIYIFAAKLPG